MSFYYSVFGLLLQSNRSLPGVLPCAQSDTQVDLHLLLETSPDFAARTVDSSGDSLRYASADTDERGEPQLRVWKLPNGHSRIEYSDGTTFWIDEKLSTIWGSWPATLSLENAASYFFGPILGILLRFRGQVCLHASAVVLGDECLVLSGPAGAGKSTTAAAFARAGYAVLSDDIAALIDRNGTFYVTSAYPYLCLWPESVEMLYGSPDALPKIAVEWDKRQLALGTNGTQFRSSAVKLGAIYFLGGRVPENSRTVAELTPQEGMVSLLSNTYASRVLSGDMRAAEFAVLGKLVRNVPMRVVHASRDPAKLTEFCEQIADSFLTGLGG